MLSLYKQLTEFYPCQLRRERERETERGGVGGEGGKEGERRESRALLYVCPFNFSFIYFMTRFVKRMKTALKW